MPRVSIEKEKLRLDSKGYPKCKCRQCGWSLGHEYWALCENGVPLLSYRVCFGCFDSIVQGIAGSLYAAHQASSYRRTTRPRRALPASGGTRDPSKNKSNFHHN